MLFVQFTAVKSGEWFATTDSLFLSADVLALSEAMSMTKRYRTIYFRSSATVDLGSCERGREVAVGVDLRLQIGDLLLGGGDGIGAGDEAARRRLLARDRDQRLRELGRVAGLLAVLGLRPFPLGRAALGVVRDGRLRVVRRLLREELGAEEARVDDGGVDAERRDLGLQRLHPALEAELRRGVGGTELEADAGPRSTRSR